MKFSFAFAFLAGFVNSQDSSVVVPRQYRNLQATNGVLPLPTQTFFVPIPDQMVYDQIIKVLNKEQYLIRPPVMHILAVTISTDNTVVWVDHWEDGYDIDVTVSTRNSTLIWGDGNATNGCAPNGKPCNHASDFLKAGNSFVIRNNVTIPRVRTTIVYDGGDRIQSSFPITVTRAGHPHESAVLGSALQAMDTSQWGTTYEAPVGVDYGKTVPSFEWTIMVYQAGSNFTTVTLPNMTNVTLQMGDAGYYVVKQGDQITSDKPIQVTLVTGDIDPNFNHSKPETRWYGLRSVQQYHNSYITPVGDSVGKSRMLIYNPNSDEIRYSMKFLNNGNGPVNTTYGIVNSKKAVYTPVIPYGSGAIVESDHDFVALTVTDSEEYDGSGKQTYAATYDWGFAAAPTNLLTPEVLVGLGWGCLNNVCPSAVTTKSRSVVWITPTELADIYVDYQNNGTAVITRAVKALASLRVVDTRDNDMSGALIFAVKPNTGKEGTPVDIAVAWGQDPTLANSAFKSKNEVEWESTMDMGTVVLPLSIVNVAKLVDKPIVKAGEELEYTIRVSNSGQKHVFANNLTLVDTLDANVQYVAGSTAMFTKTGVRSVVQDDTTGSTPFPFDEAGYKIPIDLARRGSYIDFVFKVKVTTKLSADKDVIVNSGILKKLYDGSNSSFQAVTTIDFTPAITVNNLVAHGSDEKMCEFGEDSVAGKVDTPVVYCFIVTNTGNTYLSNIQLANAELVFQNNSIKMLAPGESAMIAITSKIATNLTNIVSVIAKPTLSDGTEINGKGDINANDPSNVVMKVGIDGDTRSGDVPGKCMEDKWKSANNTDGLVCASKEVYIESLIATNAATCVPGKPVTLSVDAKIFVSGSRNDVGWYVATDGGDALVGTCVVNGLQNFGNGYNVVDVATGKSTVGTVKWTNDECGDVVIGKGNTVATMTIPLLVNATILCADDDEDGFLDFAACFNWKTNVDSKCSIASNIPGNNKGCFCTRVEVANVDVPKLSNDTIAAC